LAWKQQQNIQGVIDGNHDDNVEANESRKFFWGLFLHFLLQKARAWTARNMSSNVLCPKRLRRVYRFMEVVKQ